MSLSQEKTHLLRLEFFLLRSPLGRARSVLTYRAMCSVTVQGDPVVWVFSTSGFHRFFATKPVSSETSKQYGGQTGDHSSIGDSWPIAFSGYNSSASLRADLGRPVGTRCVPGGQLAFCRHPVSSRAPTGSLGGYRGYDLND